MCPVIKLSDAAVCCCHVFILQEKLFCIGTYFQNWKYITAFQICHPALISVVSVRIQKRKSFGERLLLFCMCVLLFMLSWFCSRYMVMTSKILNKVLPSRNYGDVSKLFSICLFVQVFFQPNFFLLLFSTSLSALSSGMLLVCCGLLGLFCFGLFFG